MLRREVQALKTQLKKALDSAAQPVTGAHNSTQAEAVGQPSSSALKPDPDADRLRKAGSSGAAESGLPSPSLPATPHSPVDSPRGDVTSPAPLLPHCHPPPPPLPRASCLTPIKPHGVCGGLSSPLGAHWLAILLGCYCSLLPPPLKRYHLILILLKLLRPKKAPSWALVFLCQWCRWSG